MGTVHMMVKSRESEQAKRFRWMEGATAFYVVDTQTDQTRCMGDGVEMFCEDTSEGQDCFTVGTQRFYDALNGYFDNEQAEIAQVYFGWVIGETEEKQHAREV